MQPLPVQAASHAVRSAAAQPHVQQCGVSWTSRHGVLPLAGLVFAVASSNRRSVTCHQRAPKVDEEPIENKAKDLGNFREKFMKKYGSDAIVDFDQLNAQVPVFSTGALTLDLALGGGMPYGKLVEVYGPEQSGKTTLALSCCVWIQKSGRNKRCAFIDVEHALNLEYAKQMGLDLDKTKFVLTQPDSAEKALDQALDFAESGHFDLVIIDSVAQLVPKEEDEKDMGGSTIGMRARLLSKFCRSWSAIVK
eukprot:Skav226140  [mRNA]  locus=scaffold1047:566141:566890:- [translate_table: standard]